MISVRSLCSIALVLVASGAAGCKEDPPPPQPELASSATPNKGKANMKTPVSPVAKVDPQSMKEYRVDVCYFGTLSLKQARDAYLASLGKDEPSEKKIPSFGTEELMKPADAKAAAAGKAPAPGAAAPAAAPKTAAAPAAKDGAPAAAAAASGGKPAPAASLPRIDERRPFNFSARAPHERNARACTVALSLKDPAMPDVDAALVEYAPYATELAKNIAAAANYYQREEYKKDSFAKGKELHKKLLADFEKLDASSDKLGLAVSAWHSSHLPDLDKAEEGQKAALTALEDARALMLMLSSKNVDPAAARTALQKVEASAGALKAYGTTHQNDPWFKIMSTALDKFIGAVKEADPKLTDKGISSPSLYLPVITNFVGVIEGKHRALSRSLIGKSQPQLREPAGAPGQPAQPAQPTQPAAPEPEKE
ncbi:hypothetical protein SOCE26_015150 [Sorangium cellulosum]|uniref:DUF3829 domain-containing protein n=1 Tax=Sorangium cellulosum TaxID=56 RepID=A0A2L0ELE9_SORCE|nr:DUF3829 domain-containing protein [Sorangium cellulosum]AUX40118.1 hypothetical protein SOCE26_015150 [Sorangium cellulosum]